MDKQSAAKLWVEHWQRVGPMLEKIEHDELRAFSFERDWQVVDSLLQLGCDVPNAKAGHESGLIEQQRLFGKSRR